MAPSVQSTFPVAGAPHALVIGSGFGGLAAAIRLRVKGYQVTVLEKLAQPGGRASVFRQDGFVFDAGPTIVTAPFLLEELWSLCGRRLQDDVRLVPMDPFYRIRFADGSHFDYSGDAQAMREEIRRFCPADLPGYERFMARANECYRLGFEELGSVAFDSLRDLLAAIPNMVRMRAWRSIHAMVCEHFRDERLRIVMSFHPLLIGGNPFSVTSVYSLIASLERRHGVHFAMGGTGALIRGMVKLLEGLQVAVRCGQPVKSILIEDGAARGVVLDDGSTVHADLVVSNADTAYTYRHMIAPEHRRFWTDRRIARGRYSMSLFVWYFGTDRRYEEVPHHMLILGPRYEALLRDIFRRHRLAHDFSLYLHRPTATDPSLAPPGCDTFYALSPVPHLDSATDWNTHQEPYRQAVQKALEASVLPGLGGHLRTSRMVTPLYFEHELRSIKGAAFGLEPLLTQSAWFRPHNRSEDVRDLYFVGAGTHPGAGIPGVLSSAKALDSVLPAAVDYGRTTAPADRRRRGSPAGPAGPAAPVVRPVARAAQSR
ncbi:MAG: phytoene desaturase [Betaproteobacteria bacterium]|nr:phytoene desaturase [Betaproteobacteria bacterium]